MRTGILSILVERRVFLGDGANGACRCLFVEESLRGCSELSDHQDVREAMIGIVAAYEILRKFGINKNTIRSK